MALVPVHELMAAPAVATGWVPQVMVRDEVAFTHPLVPVSVKVAEKLPEAAVGVKVARAGFAFCAQLPLPAPPLQVGVPL